MLFLPFSLVFGTLARDHGIHWAGWVLAGVTVTLALMLSLSTRRASHADARPPRPVTDVDIACRELVGLPSSYLDGELDPQWRARVDAHLRDCDGCTNYLDQIRATVELLAQLETKSARDTEA